LNIEYNIQTYLDASTFTTITKKSQMLVADELVFNNLLLKIMQDTKIVYYF